MTALPPKPELVRAIGRWTLTGLVLNAIIGSGIFGLPDDVARFLGPAAPWAYVIASAAVAIFIAMFAELASQYRESGGVYLYARDAFGRLAGIQVGWFAWLVRLTTAGAVVNLCIIYLGEFWPAATTPAIRAVLIVAMVGGLAALNIRGVRAGARVSNAVTIAKLAPLALFIVVGLALLKAHMPAPAAENASAVTPTLAQWSDALVVLIFACGGFEAAVIPAGETKDPRRDAPFALFTALALVTTFYLLIHFVAMRALPDLAHSERPLADAARVFSGPAGAAVIALGAIVSTAGWLAGSVITSPRLTFALAERGDFPAFFARVNPRYRTPHVSILLWAAIVIALALTGGFLWNATLSGITRLVTYGAACAAVIRLRRRQPGAAAFRVPGGDILALLGIAFCVALAWRLTAEQAAIVGGVAVIATVNWIAVRRNS